RRRSDGHLVELPRRDAARPPGAMGGFTRRISPDAALQVVELARQLPRREGGQPAMGQGVGRRRGRFPEYRGKRTAMSAFSTGGGSCNAGIARLAADLLSLAAAPTFATMALS